MHVYVCICVFACNNVYHAYVYITCMYMYVCMSVCLSARPVCLSFFLSFFLFFSFFLSFFLPVRLCVNVLFHCTNAWPALLIPTRAQQHPNGGNGCGIATQVAHTSRHDRQGIDAHEEVQVVPVNANCRPPSHSQETIKSSKTYQIESGDSKSLR
jgi:hypothetical protein